MRIPRPVVDRIYAALDILEVVQDYVPLKKRGQNYWGLSPFKAERTPSFAVNPNKGIFKDFSSGKGGNAVTFLMELEGYTYTEALLHLAKKYAIEVPELEAEDRGVEDKRTSLYALNKFAAEWYQRQLATEEGQTIGLSYFTERGISQPAREAYGLGYSPEQWDAFTQTAQKIGYAPELLIEVGLTLRSEDGTRLYDRFRGRVIFPIHDGTGRVAGFAGRLLKTDAKAAKYVNSPESLIYNKSQLLYGLYQARQAIREAGQVILTEGYTDVIALHQAGVKHAVASSGTSLTEGQIALFARYARSVLVLYDGDAAGIQAALRAMDLIVAAGLAVKAVVLPEGHDPDSYVRTHGGEVFKQYAAEQALDVVAFKLRSMGLPDAAAAQAAGPDAVARAVQELGQTLARIPDDLTRSLYAGHAARQLGVSEALVIAAVNQAAVALARQQGQQRPQPPTEASAPPHPEGPLIAPPQPGEVHADHSSELELLRVLFNNAERELPLPEGGTSTVEATLLAELRQHAFELPAAEALRQAVIARADAGLPFSVHPYLGGELGPAVQDLATRLMLELTVSPNWGKLEIEVPDFDADIAAAYNNSYDLFLLKHLRRMLEANREELKAATDPAVQDQLLLRERRLRADYLDPLTRRLDMVLMP